MRGGITDPSHLFAPVARGDIKLTAEDRLQPGLARPAVEFDDAVHLAVVGDRHRRHVEGLRLLHEAIDEDHSVQQAVLCMDVEVNKIRMFRCHGKIPLRVGSGQCR